MTQPSLNSPALGNSRARPGAASWPTRWLLALLGMGLLGACGPGNPGPDPARPPSPPDSDPIRPLPDFIDLGPVRLDAQVWTTRRELSRPVFQDLAGQPRLLVYAYPGVERLALPGDGLARDVAFFDLGGRALDVYPRAACPGDEVPCPALQSRFPAMMVLIAPPGLFERVGFSRGGQLRWGGQGRPARSGQGPRAP